MAHLHNKITEIMSYDLMVFAKHKRFTTEKQFTDWYNELTQWKEDRDYNDYTTTTPELQAFFKEITATFPPLNGPLAPADYVDTGEYSPSDYCIAGEAIYIAFAWSDAEHAYGLTKELARKHNLAFFDMDGHVYYPDGYVLNIAGSESGGTPYLVCHRLNEATGQMETINVPLPKDYDADRLEEYVNEFMSRQADASDSAAVAAPAEAADTVSATYTGTSRSSGPETGPVQKASMFSGGWTLYLPIIGAMLAVLIYNRCTR